VPLGCERGSEAGPRLLDLGAVRTLAAGGFKVWWRCTGPTRWSLGRSWLAALDQEGRET
jgi:hypothetical protein